MKPQQLRCTRGLKISAKFFRPKFLVNLFLAKFVRIAGFSFVFLAIAVFSPHFAREC